jgi:hypothetical protein
MVYWMTSLIKAALTSMAFAVGYLVYWLVKRKKVPAKKPDPEDYGTPVTPI